MHKKMQTFLLFLLIISTDIVIGKSNKTKSYIINNKNNPSKDKFENERMKRSISDDDELSFWPNRGKKQIDDEPNFNTKFNNPIEYNQKFLKSNEKVIKDQPFWGNRGRRDGSTESLYEFENPEFFIKHCERCEQMPLRYEELKTKDRREDFTSPFWGSRGRRNSLEVEDSDPFWGNRGRRQEKEPFWGNRGRRTEDDPFWGNRGRRDDMDPFWGNRRRRQDSDPFWGNRGRRQENEPFWGNRGRREDDPFWGNRGKRKNSERNWIRNRKEDLKDSILSVINDVEDDIENLSRLKKSNPSSFWANRGRDNKLMLLFNGSLRNRQERPFLPKQTRSINEQTAEPGTVLDNRMYVDEPNYILVERYGRSSGEDDPYYISRGKKRYLNYSFQQAARDRRGAIEEIVKSVRNDPYYIARGKKDNGSKNGNTTVPKEEYTKAKELICAAIELIMIKSDNTKVKRDITDNERDRRTILKKLAAQLQNDPYFVSRGKKNYIPAEKDYLQDFISNIAEKCN